MNRKFDAFHAALLSLLDEYNYMLTTTLYDGILVKDRRPGGSPIYCDFADATNLEPTSEPEWVTYEVLHRDFVGDGTKDHLVFWVASRDREQVADICALHNASVSVIHSLTDIDFHLPRDNERLKEALK